MKNVKKMIQAGLKKFTVITILGVFLMTSLIPVSAATKVSKIKWSAYRKTMYVGNGQQEDGQGAGQAELAFGKGRCRADDAKTCTAVGHQVHQGHAVQLHGQHLHRDLAEPLGLGICLLHRREVCVQLLKLLHLKNLTQLFVRLPEYVCQTESK